MANCIKVNITPTVGTNGWQALETQPKIHGGRSRHIKVAHLNAQSLKNRVHFHEVKDMTLQNDFDILTISESWFNSSVPNASVHIEGYKLHRLDRLRKTGGGVCAYIKDSLKTKPLKDLSGISDSGLHQLWIQIQHKKLKSLLLCVTYRPPSTAALCLEQDLMPKYIQALSLGKDIVLPGDLNCDLSQFKAALAAH